MEAYVKRSLPPAPEPTKAVRIDPEPEALFEWPELAEKAVKGAAASLEVKKKKKT